jgi:hypothetical protein
MLDEAVTARAISGDQAAALWTFLERREGDTPSFKPAHILYYLGGMIAIGAMTLFLSFSWERFGGGGLVAVAAVYAVVMLALTEAFLARPGLAIPAGITATLAIVMVPLGVYGAQQLFDLWPESTRVRHYRAYHYLIDWRWLFMELATLAAAAVALWRYRLPFMVMPLAVTLWYLSMDLAPFLFGGDALAFYSEPGKRVSAAFGLAMMALAFVIDLRSRGRKDYAFWLWLFGVLAFWGGLTAMKSGSELGKFLYLCVNLAMIAAGAALSRRVLAAFGGLGVALYLGHLSHTAFGDSMLFPVALSAIGFAVIAAGVYWQSHERAIVERLRAFLPPRVRELVAARAG